MAAVTAALLGLSAVAQAAAARKQGNFQADQLNTNASLEDQQAADAIARGKESESRQQTGLRGFQGSQRVSLAAQGIDTSSGTAADLQSDTAQLGEMDRLMLEHNAAREAYGFSSGAAVSRAQAAQARSAGNSSARTTLLTAASQLYAMKGPSAPAKASTYPDEIQQTYDAGRNPASNDYSRIKIRQPKYPGR